ncbi:MAG: hypothetical protein N3B21_17855 [Clostridia bacterium]|nr:hypothetical protein [Clostridia bacterium]
MNPPKTSRNLENFREEYLRYLSYVIIPVHFKNNHELEPLFDYSIEKTELFFKNTNEITPDDLDYCCLKNGS